MAFLFYHILYFRILFNSGVNPSFFLQSFFRSHLYASIDIIEPPSVTPIPITDIVELFLDIDMDDSFDKGSIAFGINQTIHRNEQFGIALGCMFTFDAFENDMANQELDLYSL